MFVDKHTERPLTILVVDDDADTAGSLAELLSLYGHATSAAFDGEDALAQVAAAPPDVVLLDICMPGVDGCEVARTVRARCEAGGKRPFLIAITGCGPEKGSRAPDKSMFDMCFIKPVEPAVLIGALERIRRLLAPPIPRSELEGTRLEPPKMPREPRDDPSKSRNQYAGAAKSTWPLSLALVPCAVASFS